MASPVLLQIGQLAEGLLTAGIKALVRLHAGVDARVLLQVGQLLEGLLAESAVVRLDIGVHPRVLAQVGRGGEPFPAVFALVRLTLRVRAGMEQHVRLTVVHLGADLTVVLLPTLLSCRKERGLETFSPFRVSLPRGDVLRA